MNYIKITNYDTANGPGVRTVLWVAGCNHYCKNCHNPQTWDENAGITFGDETVNKIIESLKPEYIHGLTFSGGDPLYPKNRDTVLNVAKTIKTIYPDKDIWLWTGYKWNEICDLKNLKYIDVLVDGPFIEEFKDMRLPYCGSTNQRVIDVKKSLELNKVVLYG